MQSLKKFVLVPSEKYEIMSNNGKVEENIEEKLEENDGASEKSANETDRSSPIISNNQEKDTELENPVNICKCIEENHHNIKKLIHDEIIQFIEKYQPKPSKNKVQHRPKRLSAEESGSKTKKNKSTKLKKWKKL